MPSEESKKQINKDKNRFGNLATYDHSRVQLQINDSDEGSDYINASYIEVYLTYCATVLL